MKQKMFINQQKKNSIKVQCVAIDFVLKAVVEIIPSSIESLKKVKNLMKKYAMNSVYARQDYV
jgi:hypothetical protein